MNTPTYRRRKKCIWPACSCSPVCEEDQSPELKRSLNVYQGDIPSVGERRLVRVTGYFVGIALLLGIIGWGFRLW